MFEEESFDGMGQEPCEVCGIMEFPESMEFNVCEDCLDMRSAAEEAWDEGQAAGRQRWQR